MRNYFRIKLLHNTVSPEFIHASMKDNFQEMADLCGVKLQLPANHDKPIYALHLMPAGYNLLSEWVEKADKVDHVIKLSAKVGYWIFNEFYLTMEDDSSTLPTAPIESYFKGRSSGVFVFPTNMSGE